VSDIATDTVTDTVHPSACILCECNCGVEITLQGRNFTRVRGDERHPSSAGYTCEKALRLDRYQNGRHRLTTPLRRRPDGTHEEVSWDVAIAEIADRLQQVKATHGGEKIFFYGGGGQGNHLGGIHGRALQAALGAHYTSNPLAQEKTGEMWVDGKLYGGHTRGDAEHAEVVLFLGKNPWQSHGLPRARPVLKEIARDPARTMIVLDPRRSETAAMAEFHLQVRPGTDAWCLTGMLGVVVQEDLTDTAFVAEHTAGAEQVLAVLADVDVPACARECGVPEELLRAAARRFATAASAATFEDLGVQQSPHSTLVSYLNKLLWILTGNFGRPGTMYLHSSFAPVAGSQGAGSGRGRVTPVTGARIIAGLVPCNSIAEEILTDHPDRFRAMWVDSSNPAHSLADSAGFREALAALDLVVVIDVALTETAALADYVLPAASQYEKWECTFFNVDFPHNSFQLRPPVLPPLGDTLPEPEIYARVLRALGAVGEDVLAPLAQAAELGRPQFRDAFFAALAEQPQLMGLAPYVLHETLGRALPEGQRGAAAVWGLAQLCALGQPDAVRRAGHADGDALFDAILSTPTGVTFTVDTWPDVWNYVRRPDRRFTVAIPELLEQVAGLAGEAAEQLPAEFPLVLSAGERRSFTANTIFRDPAWRRRDRDGALRISPQDAGRLGLSDGQQARITTLQAAATAVVEITDVMQAGHVSLPNGYGLSHPDGPVTGVAPNELTGLDRRDPIAGTPWHKNVPCRVEALVESG
jgi:anaerobic selenocysteine-containing dehydrogenase